MRQHNGGLFLMRDGLAIMLCAADDIQSLRKIECTNDDHGVHIGAFHSVIANMPVPPVRGCLSLIPEFFDSLKAWELRGFEIAEEFRDAELETALLKFAEDHVPDDPERQVIFAEVPLTQVRFFTHLKWHKECEVVREGIGLRARVYKRLTVAEAA